ncbi:FtsK/SpoIIIE domain-containing protein [Microbacterium sp. LS_15]|uniref:FtsK/SpoIIIE domain-containing protein n=1 Tax=Microbacterium sp. LS_15 TaxID=3055790 RepID=UPI0035BEBD7E
MTWTWHLEREYWASEIPLLLRRGWWFFVLLVILASFGSIPGTGHVIDWLLLGVLALIVVRRVRAARDLSSLPLRKWQRRVEKWMIAAWPALAKNLGLAVKDLRGTLVLAGVGHAAWNGQACMLPVALPAGLAREDLVAATPRIAQAFNAVRVTVVGHQLGALALRIDYVDSLAQPFSFPLGIPWDGATVPMGIADGGAEWRLPLGPHTLVAGSSGSGKASLVWGLLLGLAEPIHSGLVEVWGIDRKGGMELAMGRDLLTRFAADAAHSVQLLEEAIVAMQERARSLAGITRQQRATVESPTVIVLIDELAALTAYETDRELLRRANAAIATLASQGRAVGFIVFACLQDPRKETLLPPPLRRCRLDCAPGNPRRDPPRHAPSRVPLPLRGRHHWRRATQFAPPRQHRDSAHPRPHARARIRPAWLARVSRRRGRIRLRSGRVRTDRRMARGPPPRGGSDRGTHPTALCRRRQHTAR